MQPPLSPLVKKQFASDENDPLRKIVQVIVQACWPEQIFVINYGFLVKDFSLLADFLILVPDRTGITSPKLQKAIDEGCASMGSITVTLDQPAKVYKSIMQGHIFFSWVCRPNNLIYDTGKYCLPAVQTIDVKPFIEKSRFVFDMGYQRAQAFLDGARYYFTVNNYRMVACMLGQATVQVLIAFLAGLTGYNHFTYKITRLFRFTRRITDEFFLILPRQPEEESEILQLLCNAYSKARYSNNFVISEEQSVTIFALVVQLLPLAASEFQKSITNFERSGERTNFTAES